MSKIKKPTRSLFEIVNFPEKKGDHQVSNIIQAAIRVISKDGIENASFENIGKEAGIIKAHVNYYFKEKDDLISSVLEYVLSNAQKMTVDRLKQQSNPKLLLKELSDVSFDWVEENKKHLPVILLLYYYCSIRPKLRTTHSLAREVARNRLKDILKGMGVKAKLDEKAFAIHSIIAGYLIEIATSHVPFSVDETKQQCWQQIQKICD